MKAEAAQDRKLWSKLVGAKVYLLVSCAIWPCVANEFLKY